MTGVERTSATATGQVSKGSVSAVMYWYCDGHAGGWGYAVLIVGMLLLWAVIIGVGILTARAPAGSRTTCGAIFCAQPPAPRQSPEQVLAERYAREEIDKHGHDTRPAALRERHRCGEPASP